MSTPDRAQATFAARWQGVTAWLLLATITICAAWLALDRVRSRRLFLISLPFDRQPFPAELDDAQSAAGAWTVPALIFLALAVGAVGAGSRGDPATAARLLRQRLQPLWRAHRQLCRLFLAACVADFLSTAHYFHTHRVDDELHPGIKLVTYAFGLTIGCLLGKLIHALLALTLCALFPKLARSLLVVLILAYSAAAIWNLWLANA